MIFNPADIEASVDAWAKGERSDAFNTVATQDTPRRVDMAPANDSQPGILGFNR